MMALYAMSASLNSKAGDHGGSAEDDSGGSSSSSNNCGGSGRDAIRPMHKRTNRGAEAVARALLARKDEYAAVERADATAAAAAAAAATVVADASASRGGGGGGDGGGGGSADHHHRTPSNRSPPLKSLLTFGDVLSVLRSLPFAQNAARRNVMAEGVPWIYRCVLVWY
jgi:hypothetical protein